MIMAKRFVFFLFSVCSVLQHVALQQEDVASELHKRTCGTKFTDPASSALLADVVLQGTVEQLRQASPLAPLLYKANVTVHKVYKGQELLSQESGGSRLRARYVMVERFGPDENKENCVARVTTGQTYLFYLKLNDDQNGQRLPGESSRSASPIRLSSSASSSPLTSANRSGNSDEVVFVNSALPSDMDLEVLRQAKRVLCPGCASEPVIDRIRCKNCAVRPIMRRKMSPSDTKIVRLGKQLTLRCVARATPRPTYTWYKDGQRLGNPPSETDFDVTVGNERAAVVVFRSGELAVRNTRRHSLLTIKSVAPEDQGVYRCVAANAVGEAEQNAEVVVDGKAPPAPNTGSVAPGSDVTSDSDVTSGLCPVNICYHGGTCYKEEGGKEQCACTSDYHGRKCQFRRRKIEQEPDEDDEAEGGQESDVTIGEGSEGPAGQGLLGASLSGEAATPNSNFEDLNRRVDVANNNVFTDSEGTAGEDTDEDDTSDFTHTDSTLDTDIAPSSSFDNADDTVTTPSTSIRDKQRGKYLLSSRGRYGTDVTSASDAKDSKSSAPKLKVSECPDTTYCLNGGHCKIVVKIQRRFCECLPGFGGRRCELRI